MKRYHEKTVEKYCKRYKPERIHSQLFVLFNLFRTKRDWPEEEVKTLVELAQAYRIGTYIPFNYRKAPKTYIDILTLLRSCIVA